MRLCRAVVGGVAVSAFQPVFQLLDDSGLCDCTALTAVDVVSHLLTIPLTLTIPIKSLEFVFIDICVSSDDS